MRTEHAYYVTFDKLGGEEHLAAFRTVLRRAAKAAGMRVHTFRGAHDPILWINNPDYTPSAEALRAAVLGAAADTRLGPSAPPLTPPKLRILD